MLAWEWWGRDKQYALATLSGRWNRPLRFLIYLLIIAIIFWCHTEAKQFIYFQF
jgi:hypothetical protein